MDANARFNIRLHETVGSLIFGDQKFCHASAFHNPSENYERSESKNNFVVGIADVLCHPDS